MRFRTGTGRACRVAAKQPGLPFARLQAALGLRPRRALSSAEATTEIIPGEWTTNEIDLLTQVFDEKSEYRNTLILFLFAEYRPVFFDQAAKEAAIKLLVRGIEDVNEAVNQAAAMGIENNFPNAVNTLAPLRNALKRDQNALVKEALNGAIDKLMKSSAHSAQP